MADIKISQLGAAATISDSDVFPMTANGTTVKAAASLIKEYAIGDDDISALGDGSPTGAILALNANKSEKSDIAMIEASVAIAPHAIGAEFYLSGVLMRATAPIEIGDQIVNGTNCAPADDVSSQIQALTNKKIEYRTAEAVGDGVKTVSELLDELFAYIDDVTPYAMIVNYFVSGQYIKHELMAVSPTQMSFGQNSITSSETIIENLLIRASGSSQRNCTLKYSDNSITYSSADTAVPNVGDKYVLYY